MSEMSTGKDSVHRSHGGLLRVSPYMGVCANSRPCFRSNVLSRVVRQMYPPLRPANLPRSVAMSHTRPAKASGNALVAVSGGAGSVALLDILTKADYTFIGSATPELQEKRRGAKDVIWERGTVLYVEFCGIVDDSDDRTSEMRTLAEQRGLDFIGLKAEDVFDPSLPKRLGRTQDSGQHLFADLTHPG